MGGTSNEAFPWDEAPHYLIRDRDRIYGSVVTRRLRAMGIRDKPTAPASPWQNAFAERLIGSIRRECSHLILLAVPLFVLLGGDGARDGRVLGIDRYEFPQLRNTILRH